MESKISILGCGPSGIQTAVYLLEQYHGEIIIYDSDIEYAKGMALDCMQAAAVRGWQSKLVVAEHVSELENSEILIITENRRQALENGWIHAAKAAMFTIYASIIPDAIATAYKEGVSEYSIIGVQGMVDAGILTNEIAKELNIYPNDIQTMIYGETGHKMKSSPDLVRIHGIPINLISEGLFEKALNNAKNNIPYEDKPWAPHYSLASAAVELALVMKSGQDALLPLTGAKETFPTTVGNFAIKKIHRDMV